VPALPSWLTQPLWDQFATLLPARPVFDPTHPLHCHRRRIDDRIVFDKLVQVLRFGCSYEAIADSTCSASTIRNRRDEWITLKIFSQLKQIALNAYDRIVGLLLETCPWMAPSPKPPVVVSAPVVPRWIAANRA
jgi:transposase